MEEGNLNCHELRLQEKKAEEMIAKLSEEKKQVAIPLLEIQRQRNTLYLNYLQELKELQEKYEQSYQPLYEQRRALLSSVPGFWFKSIKNNTVSCEFLYEQDEALLQFLVDIRHKKDPNSENFSIEFEFADNPIIENKILKKDYFMANEDVMEKAIGTEIIWRGNNLTQQVKKSKKKGKQGKEPKTERIESRPSFFNFFKNVMMPAPQDLEAMDEEDEHEIVKAFEQDFDLATEFRDEIIPNAMLFYLNIREESDEGDAEENQPKPVKVDGSGSEKQECKQQ
ncbi:unnamed protein product [Blepharisma stoltei]|uniref:Nucleosome assembly protein n=1 Tax=Blepharisma stoltei TaxID=1481888 RepID=A0AAU9IIB4_9CILI|nr:unnamed protein product [Blepharisma stoltei]